MNVIAALSKIMAELPAIGKDSQASAQQGGYNYRGIEAITREAQPLLAKHGVVFVPHVQSAEVVDILVNSKPWSDTRLLVSYTVYGPGGIDDCIEVGPIFAIGRDNADKGANKCMTQAFKYALIQALCISDAKDDGDQHSYEADARPAGLTVAGAKRQLLEACGGDKLRAAALWSEDGAVDQVALDRLLVLAASGEPFEEVSK